ncbi:hypothetical protein [Streptomyces sp. NBC_01187]|uniref:hypothetical protein n=1 Tax=Streptomyces sp. NBC_01187 TaxID=2903766 RepID=UPI00386A2A52|nr:hypothetical protein OG220_37080 [Streptomyces sp. NBC_01187]
MRQRDRDPPSDVARDLVVGGRSGGLGEVWPTKGCSPFAVNVLPSMAIALGPGCGGRCA